MARPELFTDETSEIGAVFDMLRRGRPAWQKDALCREYPLVTWFPDKGAHSLVPKQICQRCLVVNECGEWAMQQDPDLDGIWGGLNRAERARIRRGRRAA
jgi:transcription factor WhiB